MATTAMDLKTRVHYLNADYGVKSWLLTTDHKRIALLYLVSITLFFLVGGVAAVLMRIHLLEPNGAVFEPSAYNKLFSMHGIVMVFLFLIPSIPAVLGNFLVPMMIGARDVAFPKLNLLSWYLFMTGGCMIMYAVMSGGVDTGWTFYTPLSTLYLNTHVMTAALGVFVAGFSSILTGLNFVVTIQKMRAPGMTWFRMPLFLWSMLATSLIQILGTPVLAITLSLVALERVFHVGVFDPAVGGDPILFQHLFLVLLAPGCLHHDPSLYGSSQRIDRVLFQKAYLRLQLCGFFQRRHCGDWVSRVGPPHVCKWAIGLRRNRLLRA